MPLRRSDAWVGLGLLAVGAGFGACPFLQRHYEDLNTDHAFVLSFIKFAVLATFGEALALRIRTGAWNQPGFGMLPRALLWGLYGILIKIAFVIFATGAPAVFRALDLGIDAAALKGPLGVDRVLLAFAISVSMNAIFGPILMTLHKITDTHIVRTGGTLSGLLSPLDMAGILGGLDWNVQWHFVYKKTLPLFWVPAHTLTFLLPPEHQVLFAAALGVALGVLLAVAAARGRPKEVRA